MIKIKDLAYISNNAVLQFLHKQHDKDLYKSLNDGTRCFSIFVNDDMLAENATTQGVYPVKVQMLIIAEYEPETKQLEISISNIVISQKTKGFVFKDKDEINDLATYLKDMLLRLYTCSLF